MSKRLSDPCQMRAMMHDEEKELWKEKFECNLCKVNTHSPTPKTQTNLYYFSIIIVIITFETCIHYLAKKQKKNAAAVNQVGHDK
jgi:hypothetical protein